MIVTFDRALIERLLAHAEAASERRATLTQLLTRGCANPGTARALSPLNI